MKRTTQTFFAILLIAGMGVSAQAGRKDHTLVVMPSRYTVVQFAFDVARMRPVELLAYDRGTQDEPLKLHAWDTSTGKWKAVDPGAYQDGSLFTARPKRVFIVGEEGKLPSVFAVEPTWARDVVTIPSLKVVDMANTMDEEMKFSRSEWKALAGRHNLDLVDENADKRRYGRYGKPGTTPNVTRPENPLIARLRSIGWIGDDDDAPAEDAEEVIDEVEAVEEAAEMDEPSDAVAPEAVAPQADMSAAEPEDEATAEIEEAMAPYDK